MIDYSEIIRLVLDLERECSRGESKGKRKLFVVAKVERTTVSV